MTKIEYEITENKSTKYILLSSVLFLQYSQIHHLDIFF